MIAIEIDPRVTIPARRDGDIAEVLRRHPEIEFIAVGREVVDPRAVTRPIESEHIG